MNIEKIRSEFEHFVSSKMPHLNTGLLIHKVFALQVWQAAHESKQAKSVCLSESTKNEKQTDLSLVSDNQSVRVPDRWQALPIEPTHDMMVHLHGESWHESRESYYKLLEAAPSLPVQREGLLND